MIGPHRIPQNHAIFIVSSFISICDCIINVCLCLTKYKKYNIHSVPVYKLKRTTISELWLRSVRRLAT